MSVQLAALVVAGALPACSCLYSSFWAPLLDPRLLNYRVEAPFPPAAGRAARHQYEARYGPRGVNLVAGLGNGKGPGDYVRDEEPADVKFSYTYPGARADRTDYRYYYT